MAQLHITAEPACVGMSVVVISEMPSPRNEQLPDFSCTPPSAASMPCLHHGEPEQQVAGRDTGRGSLVWRHRLQLSRA